MNLGEVREWFLELSGRGDLVTAAGADNGSDKYIRSGVRYLDRLSEHHKEISRVFRIISAGDYFVRFQDARVIQKVGLATSTAFKGWLDVSTLDALMEDGDYDEPFASLTRGEPTVYAPAFLRSHDIDGSLADAYAGYVTTMVAWKSYNGVILLPPADQAYQVEVWGKFYSETLSADNDSNFWSVNEPQILIWAAMRQLEISYRNTEGRKDWESAIASELFGRELDFVEEAIMGVDQLEG